MMEGAWASLYDDTLRRPSSDPFLALPHFAGGMPATPTDLRPLVSAGRIAVLPSAELLSVDKDGVTFSTATGSRTVRCAAVVAATGYRRGCYDFLDARVRRKLGIERIKPREGWEERVKRMRARWTTVAPPDREVGFLQEEVFRGILPVGRWKERDLAITGGTKRESVTRRSYSMLKRASLVYTCE